MWAEEFSKEELPDDSLLGKQLCDFDEDFPVNFFIC